MVAEVTLHRYTTRQGSGDEDWVNCVRIWWPYITHVFMYHRHTLN